MKHIQVFLLFGFVLIQSVEAKDECDHQESLSTAELSNCTGVELKAADSELNDIYGKLLKKLDPEGQDKLKASQRAWISFRDAYANFRADRMRGGNWQPIMGSMAVADLTRQRVMQLKEDLEYQLNP